MALLLASSICKMAGQVMKIGNTSENGFDNTSPGQPDESLLRASVVVTILFAVLDNSGAKQNSLRIGHRGEIHYIYSTA